MISAMPAAAALPAPLRLPSLTRQQARWLNELHRPRRPIEFSIGAGIFTLDRRSVLAGNQQSQIAIGLRIGARPAQLLADSACIQALLAAGDADLAFDPLPPADLLALLLEAALGSLLDRLETILAMPVALGTASGIGGAATFAGRLTRGAETWPVAVQADADLLERLLTAWPPSPRPLDTLPMPATLRFGMTRLPAGLLATLRPGDMVLPEAGGIRDHAMLVVGERWLAAAIRRQGAWHLERTLHEGGTGLPEEGRWMMDGARRETGEPVAIPDEIPVQLCFELGRQDMALGQLRDLAPGMVLDLAQLPDELVEIRANGRSIGRGALVEIDGKIGVRIVRIFDHG
jgi:type III secretion protein Q